jgi:hypothetical protein
LGRIYRFSDIDSGGRKELVMVRDQDVETGRHTSRPLTVRTSLLFHLTSIGDVSGSICD